MHTHTCIHVRIKWKNAPGRTGVHVSPMHASHMYGTFTREHTYPIFRLQGRSGILLWQNLQQLLPLAPILITHTHTHTHAHTRTHTLARSRSLSCVRFRSIALRCIRNTNRHADAGLCTWRSLAAGLRSSSAALSSLLCCCCCCCCCCCAMASLASTFKRHSSSLIARACGVRALLLAPLTSPSPPSPSRPSLLSLPSLPGLGVLARL